MSLIPLFSDTGAGAASAGVSRVPVSVAMKGLLCAGCYKKFAHHELSRPSFHSWGSCDLPTIVCAKSGSRVPTQSMAQWFPKARCLSLTWELARHAGSWATPQNPELWGEDTKSELRPAVL